MSLEHALLGLLAEGEASGYELTKIFELSMSHYWHAGHSQIYPLLDKMEKQGLITFEHVVQKDKPNKKVYRITPKGKEILLAWLQTPAPVPRFKNEMLLKARFFGNLPDDEAAALLRAHKRAHQATLEEYLKMEATYFPDGIRSPAAVRRGPYGYFTLRRGILYEQDELRWCRWALSELRKKRARDRGEGHTE
jgi:DNA-binding PadR family transcriptional regulator